MYSRLHRTPPRRKSGTDQATGLTIELISKRLEVLREIAPHVSRVGFVSMEDGLSPALDKTNQLKFEAAAATAKALGMVVARRSIPKSMNGGAFFSSLRTREMKRFMSC